MGFIIAIFVIVIFVAIGGWTGSVIFQSKNRNPTTGATLGGLAGIFPVLLLFFIVVAALLPKLEAGQNGYFVSRTDGLSPYLPKKSLPTSANILQLPNVQRKSDISIIPDRLKEAKELLDQGLIDESEFKELKSRIINE